MHRELVERHRWLSEERFLHALNYCMLLPGPEARHLRRRLRRAGLRHTVEPYNWITRGQAVDGLALAETTPGPLIMVLQFVGFMAGWNHAEGMTPAASGVAGALVTTYTIA